ncbi:hypothetical protein CYMTET_48137 [Cymbomonas tetramitiformis]|uniref:DUF938 domain-containing protein n=1 Tax=Cymbomonas tetramitiformis TaxID=36881 RepID=A0AAE0BUP3_9CHLO|nr:hypothetical protein CYMTET_48137 [Cymbomonas tetramitiformis]
MRVLASVTGQFHARNITRCSSLRLLLASRPENIRSSKCIKMSSTKLFAPAADRNKEPICEVLSSYFTLGGGPKGVILEIASGTGQHCAHFANNLPSSISWQPTEYAGHPGPTAPAQAVPPVLASINAYTEGLQNVLPAIAMDAAAADWDVGPTPRDHFIGVLATNITHISPYSVTEGLVGGAGKLLSSEGKLMIYGPFKVDGKATPESNANFDATLKSQNPEWGLRDVEAVQALGEASGFTLTKCHNMPANNLMLVFTKK